MKGFKKLAVVTMAISSVMAVSATNAFAHHGGWHHNGGCGNGYYQSSYSCPYGNATCNQQGYCINHNLQYYNSSNYTAPANTQQQSISTDELIKILEQLIDAKNTSSVENELKKIIEANKVIEATNAAIPQATQTSQPYVCPYGNELCNQYGYCIEGCQGCQGYCR